jgi:Bacteriophage lambda head decoration protein D
VPTTPTNTFSAVGLEPYFDPEGAKLYNVKLPNSVTLLKGTLLGELTASPGTFKTYANANADGSEVAKAILQYDVSVDSSGNHMVGGGEHGETLKYAPAYFAGTFRTTELVGLDAPALTDLGRLISGSLADGVLRLG